MLIQSIIRTPKGYRRLNVMSDNFFKKFKFSLLTTLFKVGMTHGKRIHAFNCPKLKITILTLDHSTVVCM